MLQTGWGGGPLLGAGALRSDPPLFASWTGTSSHPNGQSRQKSRQKRERGIGEEMERGRLPDGGIHASTIGLAVCTLEL